MGGMLTTIRPNNREPIMDFAQEQAGDVLIVRLAGRLDSSAAPGAEQNFAGVLGGATPHLAIDLSSLEYISSAGLRVLLALRNRVDTDVKKLVVVDRAPTGDDILDDALARVSELGGELTIPEALHAIASRAEGYKERALKRLIAHRILRDEDGRFLWV